MDIVRLCNFFHWSFMNCPHFRLGTDLFSLKVSEDIDKLDTIPNTKNVLFDARQRLLSNKTSLLLEPNESVVFEYFVKNVITATPSRRLRRNFRTNCVLP